MGLVRYNYRMNLGFFGNYRSNHGADFSKWKNWDVQGIQYVSKVLLIGIGAIGLVHVGIATFSAVFPSTSSTNKDSISKSVSVVTPADQQVRNKESSTIVNEILSTVTGGLVATASAAGDTLRTVVEVSEKTFDSIPRLAANAANSVYKLFPEPIPDQGVIKLAVKPVQAVKLEREVNQNVGLATTESANISSNTGSQSKSVQPSTVIKSTEVKPVANTSTLNVSADAYLVGDLKTGKILLEHNADAIRPIASISKLITALTVKRLFAKDDTINITREALASFGDAGKLVEGETMSAQDLLYPMLIESSNDAAVAYQLQHDDSSPNSSAFVATMNSIAGTIGMKNSSFDEPSGLSAENVSTAKDLFKLVQYIKNNNPDILAITRIDSLEMVESDRNTHHIFKNNNTYAKREDFVGGKTGKTDEAKETLASVFRVADKNNRDSQSDVAIIVLKSANRIDDSNKLYVWYMTKFGKVAGSVY